MFKKIAIGLAILFVIVVVAVQILGRISSVVHVVHTFNAPVGKIWQIWNDPEMIKQWWGPDHFSAPIVQNDLRVGGSYLLSMKDPAGKIIYNTGKYTEVIEHKKIVSQMAFADEAGKAVPASTYGLPGTWPDEVTISVEFNEVEGKTSVAITETGIPTLMSLFAKMGWEQQFLKFEKLLQ